MTEMVRFFRVESCPRAQGAARGGVPRLGKSGYVLKHQTGTLARCGSDGGAMGGSDGRHIGLPIGATADDKMGESNGAQGPAADGELSTSSVGEGRSTTLSCGLSSYSASSSSDSPSESSRSKDMSTSSSSSNSLFALASTSGDDVVVTKCEGV